MVNVTGTLTYLVADTLGSVSVGLTAAGGVQATSLYAPYGGVRYSNGTMPTSYGYTQMRQDPSGLNYDHARSYDASVGQFISADAKQGPNRYGYVAGNPETSTDPTGQRTYTPCDGESAADCTPYQRPTPPPTQPTPPVPTGNGGTGGGTGGGGGGTGDGSNGGGRTPENTNTNSGSGDTCSTNPQPPCLNNPPGTPSFTRCAQQEDNKCAVYYGGIPGNVPGGYLSLLDVGSEFLIGVGSKALTGLSDFLTILKNKVDGIFQALLIKIALGLAVSGGGTFLDALMGGALSLYLATNAALIGLAQINFDDMINQTIANLQSIPAGPGLSVVLREKGIGVVVNSFYGNVPLQGGTLTIISHGSCTQLGLACDPVSPSSIQSGVND